IAPDDVAASIAADQEKIRAARYRDAFGNTWDGKGNIPQWVLHATSAGQSLEHFAISQPTEAQRKTRPMVDWGDDPFAGSRLATVKTEHVGAA
ncbi:H-NS family nucleoid-associated regulatory protein, partial [Paraburkholderia bannensis]|uniref:H-NS family nucleoid-associated regulatory protein n=1 Tax=Paraburkholderia bannensis TaxID=765414 RepID=UPI002ABD5FB7